MEIKAKELFQQKTKQKPNKFPFPVKVRSA
jgi:hypothetical protein